MQQIIDSLNDSRSRLLAMRESLRGMLIGENSVVKLPGGYMAYDSATKTASVVPLWQAPQYPPKSAIRCAEAVSDGNGQRGAPVLLVDAIRDELTKLDAMLSMIQPS